MRNEIAGILIGQLLSIVSTIGEEWLLLSLIALSGFVALQWRRGKPRIRFYLLDEKGERILTDAFVVEHAGHEGRVAPQPSPRSYYEVNVANAGKEMMVVNADSAVLGIVRVPGDANCAVLSLRLSRRSGTPR